MADAGLVRPTRRRRSVILASRSCTISSCNTMVSIIRVLPPFRSMRRIRKPLRPESGPRLQITWSEAWARLDGMRRAHLEGRWDDYEACRTCNIWSVYDDLWEEGRDASGRRRFRPAP